MALLGEVTAKVVVHPARGRVDLEEERRLASNVHSLVSRRETGDHEEPTGIGGTADLKCERAIAIAGQSVGHPL